MPWPALPLPQGAAPAPGAYYYSPVTASHAGCLHLLARQAGQLCAAVLMPLVGRALDLLLERLQR
jgi:hypothetical protein